jgi:integrase/recombinase XerC
MADDAAPVPNRPKQGAAPGPGESGAPSPAGGRDDTKCRSFGVNLIEAYLEHARVEKRLALRTVELYSLDLARLKASADEAKVNLLAVQNTHIRRWVMQMHAGGRSGRGIALILSGWRGFYAWAGREGLVTSNPVQDVRTPKSPKPVPKALGVDDAVQLVSFDASQETEGADPWLEARDSAMVELMYSSGLRVAELTGLDLQASATARGWLDLDGAEVHVLGKGAKRRSVPVGSKAMQALRRWLDVRAMGPSAAAASSALFPGRHGTRLSAQSVWQRLQKRSRQAGMSAPVHPHMLRHSFASHVLQSSGDLRAVQELLGHANISTTQVYTRLDFQHLAQVYDAAHPRAHSKNK